MKIAIDTHTHTLISGHAYNTIREMASMAAEKGYKALAITEHAPDMPGSCHAFYFQNLRVVPREMNGVELMFGVELNIMDECGTVDLPDKLVKELDISIASIHPPCYGENKGKELNMAAYINAMKKDCIDIIGHPDDGRFEVDYDILAKTARETGTLLEINNSSLKPGGFRKDTYVNAVQMLEFCKKYGTMITIGSDAHVDTDIGNCTYAGKVIEEASFPEELIANTDVEKLKSSLKRNR